MGAVRGASPQIRIESHGVAAGASAGQRRRPRQRRAAAQAAGRPSRGSPGGRSRRSFDRRSDARPRHHERRNHGQIRRLPETGTGAGRAGETRGTAAHSRRFSVCTGAGPVSRSRSATFAGQAGNAGTGITHPWRHARRCCRARRLSRTAGGRRESVTSREFQDRLARRAKRAGTPLSQDVAARLEIYFRLLETWNRKINLTGLNLTEAAPETIDRLLIEPLVAARHIPLGATRMIDIGSGGGSPAIPMALAMASIRLLMVESKTRKSVFLREAIRAVAVQGPDVAG